MKKITSSLFIIAMQTVASAYVGTEYQNGIYYTVTPSNTVTISDFENSSSVTNVVIPAEIDGKPVTAIGNSAFSYATYLQAVSIPSGIAEMGNHAFYSCKSLKNITFVENSQLTKIGSYAFRSCENLSSIKVPKGVTEIEELAFFDCNALLNVTFDQNSQLRTIGKSAFGYCSFSSINFPQSLEEIGYSAFTKCDLLNFVLIPESVNKIEENAFFRSAGIREFFVSSSNQSYSSENGVLFTKDKSTLLAYPSGSSNLEYSIPSTVTNIAKGAFSKCAAITSVAIPAGVENVGLTPFVNCGSLTNISVAAENQHYKDINGVLFTEDEKMLVRYPSGITNSTYQIPASVEVIGRDSFSTAQLSEINIPSTVKQFEDWAFASSSLTNIVFAENITAPFLANGMFNECESLKSVTIPASFKSAGYDVFRSCKSLETVKFAENSQLQTIGFYAFQNCNSLKSIDFPSSLIKIDNWALSSCTNLTSVTFAENSQLETIGDYVFRDCNALKSIAIPASVTNLGKWTFAYCDKLSSVTFAENSKLQNLGDWSFSYCKSLPEISIPASVTEISDYAFRGCSSLQIVTFAKDSQLKTIGERAFEYCGALNSITIPASVTNIGSYAFATWDVTSSLSKVIFEGNKPIIGTNAFIDIADDAKGFFNPVMTGWDDGERFNDLTMYVNPDSILTDGDLKYYVTNKDTVTIAGLADNSSVTNLVIPETINEKPVTIIADSAFEDCVQLISVEIPANVIKIGVRSFGAANYLDPMGLENITFAENSQLRIIESWAFSYCDALVQIVIPATVTNIGSSAFVSCTALKSLAFEENSQLQTINHGAFQNCHSLTSIRIPATVTNIANYAFRLCDDLSSVIFEGDKPEIGASSFAGIASETIYYSSYANGWIRDAILNGIKTLPGTNYSVTYKFHYSVSKTGSATINKSDDISAPMLMIPATVDSHPVVEIDAEAYKNCDSIEMIILSEGLAKIGANAFADCGHLKTVIISSTVSDIEPTAFKNSWIESITVVGGDYYTAIDNVLYNKDVTTLVYYAWGKTNETYKIPDTVTKIEDSVFENADLLETVSVPNQIAEIGDNAFKDCAVLNSVKFNGNKPVIGIDAFSEIGQNAEGRFYAAASGWNGVTQIDDLMFTSIGFKPVYADGRTPSDAVQNYIRDLILKDADSDSPSITEDVSINSEKATMVYLLGLSEIPSSEFVFEVSSIDVSSNELTDEDTLSLSAKVSADNKALVIDNTQLSRFAVESFTVENSEWEKVPVSGAYDSAAGEVKFSKIPAEKGKFYRVKISR